MSSPAEPLEPLALSEIRLDEDIVVHGFRPEPIAGFVDFIHLSSPANCGDGASFLCSPQLSASAKTLAFAG